MFNRKYIDETLRVPHFRSATAMFVDPGFFARKIHGFNKLSSFNGEEKNQRKFLVLED